VPSSHYLLHSEVYQLIIEPSLIFQSRPGINIEVNIALFTNDDILFPVNEESADSRHQRFCTIPISTGDGIKSFLRGLLGPKNSGL
jgi:hypothetical protein